MRKYDIAKFPYGQKPCAYNRCRMLGITSYSSSERAPASSLRMHATRTSDSIGHRSRIVGRQGLTVL